MVLFGSFYTHTFYFQAEISTLAFGPKRVVVDGWGMSLGMATSPIPWRGGARCVSSPSLLCLWLYLFSHPNWGETTGNGVTTGLLFEELLQRKVLGDSLGLKRWRGSTWWSSQLPHQHGRDISLRGFPVICSVKSSNVCSQHLK